MQNNDSKVISSVMYQIFAPVVLAFLYLLATPDSVDYGYYTAIRVISFISIPILILLNFRKHRKFNFYNVSSFFILILYNPIFPISMDRLTWRVFDFVSAIIMGILAFNVCNELDGLSPKKSEIDKANQEDRANHTYAAPSVSDLHALRSIMIIQAKRILDILNDRYDLGLFDGDIMSLAESDSPFSDLENYVPSGSPSMEEFFNSLVKTIRNVSHGINLSKETADSLCDYSIDIARELIHRPDVYDTMQLYSVKEEALPDELKFLAGKIDYLALTLVIFEHYANSNNNEYIKEKVTEIHSKTNLAL